MFLSQTHPDVRSALWKRTSKFHDAQGRVVRIFEGGGHEVLLAETATGLVDITYEMPSPMGMWDTQRSLFSPLDVRLAHQIFDTGEQAAASYSIAMPSLMDFWFCDVAGEHEKVYANIRTSSDPAAVVTGLSLFFSPRHQRDYDSHLSWAIQPFLPPSFIETEECVFAVDERWSMVFDQAREDAIADGRLPRHLLMDVVRDLAARGFRYQSTSCELRKVLGKGVEYRKSF